MPLHNRSDRYGHGHWTVLSRLEVIMRVCGWSNSSSQIRSDQTRPGQVGSAHLCVCAMCGWVGGGDGRSGGAEAEVEWRAARRDSGPAVLPSRVGRGGGRTAGDGRRAATDHHQSSTDGAGRSAATEQCAAVSRVACHVSSRAACQRVVSV